MIRLNQFFQELKTRNVRKTMAIYIGVSLTTFGILKVFVETYNLPTTIFPYVVTILTCGCVSAFVFAWFHGKGEKQGINKREILIHSLVAIVALAISINVGSTVRRVTNRSSETIAGLPFTNMSGSKTIAVLPFVNMSSDPDQEYFSDGLSEELLNVLAKNPGLRVTSRTSSFSFKGTNTDIKTIAAKLNVQHILEGSVRKSGKILRITAQLIDVLTDAHVWSEIYDGTLENIFALQDTISRSVAAALKIVLLGKEPAIQQRETNPEAYNAYLLGKHFSSQRNNLEKAARYFQQALSIDSSYAPAWVELSRIHSDQANEGSVPIGKGYEKARLEAEKALALVPNLADAHLQIGWIKRRYDWDWSGADESYQHALKLDPGSARVISAAAGLARTLGRFDEAVRLMRRSVELNPVSSSWYFNLGLYTWYAGLLDESQAAIEKCLELNPQFPGGHSAIGLVFLEKGQPDSALMEMMRETERDWQLCGLALVYHALGNKKESDFKLAELIKGHQDWNAYQIAEIYAYRRETDKAFEWLERAYNQRDGGLPSIKGDPLLRNIEKDPRYAAFMKKMKLPV